jgi:hypothetical protein
LYPQICLSLKTTLNILKESPGGSMSLVVGLPNNSYKPDINTAWARARLFKLQKGCTRLAAASDKVYQLLAHGRWFFPDTPASSTTKTPKIKSSKMEKKRRGNIAKEIVIANFVKLTG